MLSMRIKYEASVQHALKICKSMLSMRLKALSHAEYALEIVSA
jgi:hypothetical protein